MFPDPLNEHAKRYLTDLMGEPALRPLMELPPDVIDEVIVSKIRERGRLESKRPRYSLAKK